MDQEMLGRILSAAGLEIDPLDLASETDSILVKIDNCFRIDTTKPIIPQIINGIEEVRDDIDADLKKFKASVSAGKYRD